MILGLFALYCIYIQLDINSFFFLLFLVIASSTISFFLSSGLDYAFSSYLLFISGAQVCFWLISKAQRRIGESTSASTV